jgi:hypothetical protein
MKLTMAAIPTGVVFCLASIPAWTAATTATSQEAPAGDSPPGAGGTDANPEQKAEDPADRLFEAELLEVASGDLDKALAVYKAIADEAQAPAEVRAVSGFREAEIGPCAGARTRPLMTPRSSPEKRRWGG